MTCIVAIAQEGGVWMGADSAGLHGRAPSGRRETRVHRVSDFLIGVIGSSLAGQVVADRFSPPPHAATCSVERYITTVFRDALRDALEASRVADEAQPAGAFLVAYRGRIFRVYGPAYQVGANAMPFDAIGSGSDAALGALIASGERAPADRVLVALQAAELCTAAVHGPFVVSELRAATPHGPVRAPGLSHGPAPAFMPGGAT